MTVVTKDLRDVARFVAGYAKRYAAGGFATPGAKEIGARFRVFDAGAGDERTTILWRHLTRDSARTDWVGGRYWLPSGANVAAHVARTPDGPVPDLTGFHFVYAHPEDADLSDILRAQGFAPFAVHITPASEIVTCWHQGPPRRYDPVDEATVGWRRLDLDSDARAAALAELAGLDGWDDDYPFYSDGTWSALSLRGFYPDQPGNSLKPGEMSKAWWAEHPEAADLTCQWTVLADKTPALRALADLAPSGRGFERVRLMRMDGRGGRGGRLARHTDISDKTAGTADGAVARFHLPLVTHPDIVMHTWDLDGSRRTTHLEPGSLWYLDQRKPHAVDNPTGVDRVHLVIDVLCDADVRRWITA